MTLKEQIEDDQVNVFFNTDDFAQLVTINGQQVTAIVSDEPVQPHDEPAVLIDRKKLLVRAVELTEPVLPGMQVVINNLSYIVEKSAGLGNGVSSDTDIASIQVMRYTA